MAIATSQMMIAAKIPVIAVRVERIDAGRILPLLPARRIENHEIAKDPRRRPHHADPDCDGLGGPDDIPRQRAHLNADGMAAGRNRRRRLVSRAFRSS
jgi:hypothetical protein